GGDNRVDVESRDQTTKRDRASQRGPPLNAGTHEVVRGDNRQTRGRGTGDRGQGTGGRLSVRRPRSPVPRRPSAVTCGCRASSPDPCGTSLSPGWTGPREVRLRAPRRWPRRTPG